MPDRREYVRLTKEGIADATKADYRRAIKQFYLWFKDVESVRTSVRYYKGNKGKRHRDMKPIHKTSPGQEALNANIPNPLTYLEKIDRTKKAKVLIFDIETSPNIGYVWSMWKQNISGSQLIQPWFVICWSAKWLFEDEVISDCVTPDEIINTNDSRIIKRLWDLVDEADILIAHNLSRFDKKTMNTRFILQGLTPPSPYHEIDTLTHARKQFKFPHNRLDELGKYLGVGRKIDTGGFDLWKECMDGNQGALIKMSEYCDQDVLLLEDVYLVMRPWIKPHPNIGLYIEENISSCPSCGSGELSVEGTYETTVNSYDALKCNNCGAWSRNRKTNTPLKDNEGILSSIPK